MNLQRRKFLRLAAAAAALQAIASIASAETYPTRPITMIVPFPAGGSTDALGRVIADRMKVSLKQSVIIENVSGADGSIGTGRVARAKPDGYTIELGLRGTHVLNGAFYSLSFDVLNDFAPILPLVTTPVVLLARETLPANDLRELIAWLRANPGKATMGMYTIGSRIMIAAFQKETVTRLTLVPYRGTAPAIQDLMAGQIDLVLDSPVQLPLVRAGSIKAYAVTSDTRLALAPDIPTVREMGLPALSSFTAWLGLFAPRSTPKDIIGKLNGAAVETLSDPAVRSRLTEFGMDIFPREKQTPEALGALVKADAEKWLPIIKELAIKGE
jgi:tripartite-type tricarboxylate transporter receptor subunit TctC